MKKAILPFVWILALVAVFKLADSFNSKSGHFFGIADDREQNITFQYPVEIISILAVEGEDVQQGMPILEVKRQDLTSSQSVLDEQIRRYELEKKEAQNTINSQIGSLTAKRKTMLATVNYQTHMLKLKLEQNRARMESISGTSGSATRPSPEAIEIEGLKKTGHYEALAIQAEIDNLKTQLNSASRPIDAQIAELKSNKDELQRQNKSLKVSAQFNGRIGSILYKSGDLVAAFQPIMTVHGSVPHSVKGYIHENIHNEVQIGQTVWVKSITLRDTEPALEGVVESLGRRIVEYPERLKKDPMVSAWGREVVVRLSGKNSLLFGEKVDVFLSKAEMLSQWSALEGEADASRKAAPMYTITAANPDIDMGSIEASALLWNPKENHYLLVSDEQSDDQPGIFIMDKDGAVTARLALQDGIAIDDLESISADGGYIYVSSSLSYNKKDELKPKRRKLLRFKYQQNRVIWQQEIDLFAVLDTVKDSQPDSKAAAFLTQAMNDHSIDIEAHFVKDDALYLGFKSPAVSGTSVIIKLNGLEAIFAGKTTVAEIWQTIALTDPDTGEPSQLSDMLLMGGQLILLSATKTPRKNSYLWVYALEDNQLKSIQQFPGVIAEGIAYRPELSSLVVVFDEGKDNASKYQTIKLSGIIQ